MYSICYCAEIYYLLAILVTCGEHASDGHRSAIVHESFDCELHFLTSTGFHLRQEWRCRTRTAFPDLTGSRAAAAAF